MWYGNKIMPNDTEDLVWNALRENKNISISEAEG